MSTLRISFTWEEGDPMTYDELMDQLMYLGAYNVEDEPAPEPEERPKTERKKKP